MVEAKKVDSNTYRVRDLSHLSKPQELGDFTFELCEGSVDIVCTYINTAKPFAEDGDEIYITQEFYLNAGPETFEVRSILIIERAGRIIKEIKFDDVRAGIAFLKRQK